MHHSFTNSFIEQIFYRTPAIRNKTERIQNKHIGSLSLGRQYIKGEWDVYTHVILRQIQKLGNKACQCKRGSDLWVPIKEKKIQLNEMRNHGNLTPFFCPDHIPQ